MFDFENIGGKIKGLAIFCAYACVICGIIIALIGLFIFLPELPYLQYAEPGDLEYTGLQMFKYGLIVAGAGFFSAWPLYGFGELIEKVSIIANNTKYGFKDLIEKVSIIEDNKNKENS